MKTKSAINPTLNPTISRRQFIVSASVVAGGLAMQLQSPAVLAEAGKTDGVQQSLTAWLNILPDDTVVVTVPSPEIGNGASTQYAMNIAEELECAWENVSVKFASYSDEYKNPGSFGIGLQPFFGGHSTDHDRLPYSLQLGASARERLKLAAARRLGVPQSEITARESVLSHSASGRSLRFGEVAADAAKIQLDAEPAIKPQSEWRLLGKRQPSKLQIPDIVRGKAQFGIDTTPPGTVYAALKQSPVHGGLLRSHQPEVALAMPGVKAVVVVEAGPGKGSPVPAKPTFGFEGSESRSGVAVIAEHYWQAKKALEAMPVEWDNGLGEFWSSNDKVLERKARVLDKAEGSAVTSHGTVEGHDASIELEATYHTPFCEHATMEPLNGTARFTGDSLEIWHPTQDMQQAFWVAVDESGVHPENVRIHQTLVGGGFGRRVEGDDLRAVVAIAMQYPDVPVKVIWSREESTQQGSYRTHIASRFRAGLAEDGLPLFLAAEACFSGLSLNIGYTDMPYAGAIPNVKLATSHMPMHVATGAYRAPSYNSHAFMVESFIDECANAAGIDPLDYRLQLLKDWDPAWSECLKVAAKKNGWGEALPKGQGRGIAISNWPHSGTKQAGTTVCAAVHVEVSNDGELKIHRIDVSFDSGRIVNKDAVIAQLEGGIIYGLNMTLNEGLTLKDGAIVEANFDTLPMLKMADIPDLHIHFDALSGHDRFAILGEAPVGPVGPAIGNAIYQATGIRLRSTPFKDHDLSWA